jgi:hypothetical protein
VQAPVFAVDTMQWVIAEGTCSAAFAAGDVRLTYLEPAREPALADAAVGAIGEQGATARASEPIPLRWNRIEEPPTANSRGPEGLCGCCPAASCGLGLIEGQGAEPSWGPRTLLS